MHADGKKCPRRKRKKGEKANKMVTRAGTVKYKKFYVIYVFVALLYVSGSYRRRL